MKRRICFLFVLCLCFSCLLSCTGARFTYKDAELYTVGEGSFDPEKVKSVDINWYNGSVTFKIGETDKVEIRETAEDTEAEKMRYLLTEDGELKIQCRDSLNIEDIEDIKNFIADTPEKSLSVMLPEDFSLRSVTVNAVDAGIVSERLSADNIKLVNVSDSIKLKNATAKTIELTSVSGNIEFSECRDADKLSLNSTSGNLVCDDIHASELNVITVSGNVSMCDCEFSDEVIIGTTSGGVEFSGLTGAKRSEFVSVSGDIELALLNEDISLEFKTVSGEFENRLANTDSSTENTDADTSSVYTWGTGKCRISIKTTSGNVKISKIDNNTADTGM